MPKLITLPDDLFVRIQRDAIPFVDLTEIAVIKRWADHYEASHSKRQVVELPPPDARSKTDGKNLNPLAPPDLFHTRVQGTFGAISFRKWNELVRIAHVQAYAKAGTFEKLRAITQAQIENGNYEGVRGHHFVREIGISVQGLDANHAWTYSLRLAQYCEVPIHAQVEWRHNDNAAHPGETRILAWSPKSSITEVIQP